MKSYKTIIIDGKRTIKNTLIILTFIGICAALIPLARICLNSDGKTPNIKSEYIISDVFPAAGAANNLREFYGSKLSDACTGFVSFILGFDINNPTDIFSKEIPASYVLNQTASTLISHSREINAKSDTENGTAGTDTASDDTDIPPENRALIKSADLSPKRDNPEAIIIGNETDYSVDINRMLASAPNIDMNINGPKILIIHTHATEAYSPLGSTIYDTTKGDRNTDKSENVIQAGNALYEVFKKKGIEVIHDTELHDYPSFNGSYAHSLAAIEEYIKKYPSVQIVFDVHRDSIVRDDNTKIKPLTRINGKDSAQLMFVVGTDQNGLYNPDWQIRLNTAIHFQNAINKRYPTLMRHINLRKERFNGHAAPGSMIIETGSSGNTLDEAIYAIELAGECIADYLNSLK